jgi:hypothetical protein
LVGVELRGKLGVEFGGWRRISHEEWWRGKLASIPRRQLSVIGNEAAAGDCDEWRRFHVRRQRG